MNGKWNSEAKGAWTAIARAPWLKAISLYAKGDCWNGGGLFTDERSFWLNDGFGHEQVYASSEVNRIESYSPQNQYGGECLNVYYNRLQRDGWLLKSTAENGKWNSEFIFEKTLPQKWILRKIAHAQVGSPKGKGCYWDEHQIQNNTGEIIFKPTWEWAEWVDEAIIYAENGCLYKIELKSSIELSVPKLLHDFNEYKFAKIQAPY